MSKEDTQTASGMFEIDTLKVRVYWRITEGGRRYWVENGDGKRMTEDDMGEDWLRGFLAAFGRSVVDEEITDKLNRVNELKENNRE